MLANHCRANLLLEKEYFKLKKNPIWGIDAHPINHENCLNWQAVIRGPRETLWEDFHPNCNVKLGEGDSPVISGVFTAYITFTEEYNLQPPDVFFHTIPFHPNIDMKLGKPCVDFLDDSNKWRAHYDLVFILLNLQSMLANPVIENPVNIEAAEMLRSRPKQYRQMVLNSVLASKRFEAGLPPFIPTSVHEKRNDQQAKTQSRQTEQTRSAMQKVSFEDYYKTWAHIATSRPEDLVRSQQERGGDDLSMDQVHFGVVKDDLEAELRKQLSEHNAVMYGKFKNKTTKDEDRIASLKATKVQLLKQIYFKNQELEERCEQDPIPSRNNVISNESSMHYEAAAEDEVPIDDEVDQLVGWSENLPGKLE